MKITTKRVLFLALALVMALSLAGAAFAVEPPAAVEEESVDWNTPLWYSNPDLAPTHEIDYPCNINGRNTIQKVFWSDDGNLYIIIHPQYFGGDDYDDDKNAASMLTIVDLWVYNPYVSDYVTCVEGNLLTIPQTYIQINTSGGLYLQFAVDLKYVDFSNDNIVPISWIPVYLNMSLFPSSSYSELSPAEIEKLVGFDYDTPIWFKDPDFIDEEDDVIDGYTLDGENTIQKVFYSNHDRAYYMIIHPEYFGSTSHDDPDGADAMLTIVGLAVSVRPGGGYIPCLTGNLVTVPSKYVQENDDKEPYLDCIVELMYINFDSDTVNPLTWKQAFLNINALLN